MEQCPFRPCTHAVGTRPSSEIQPQRVVLDFKTQCLLCERPCTDTNKLRNPEKQAWSALTILNFVHKTRQFPRREECEWANEVHTRLAGVINLVAEKGRYSWHCCGKQLLKKDHQSPFETRQH
uniref:Uncharacterized protein n=1 Tax=Timema bartmani TaxID=61472 RepID=A0A7R9HYL7_9NEOP|nr:unnamed protein product [Timema bartmani]